MGQMNIGRGCDPSADRIHGSPAKRRDRQTRINRAADLQPWRRGIMTGFDSGAWRASGPQKLSSLQSKPNVSLSRHCNRPAARLDPF
jgi:hypothetical protein